MQQDNNSIYREVKTKCRICLCKHEDFVNIFSYDSKCGQIWMAVIECGSVQVDANDQLPSIICVNCLENLRRAHEFRSLCLLSDQTLRHYINFIGLQANINLQASNAQQLKPDGRNIGQGYFITSTTVEPDVTAISQYLCQANAQLGQNGVPNSQMCVPQLTGAHPLAIIQTSVDQTPINHGNPIQINAIQIAQPAYQTFLAPANTATQIIDVDLAEGFDTNNFRAFKDNKIPQPQVVDCDGDEEKDGGNEVVLVVKKSNRRLRNYKPNLTGRFSCRICNKRYDTDKQLMRHESVSHGERKFKCDQCSKRFTERSVLKSHIMAIHTGDRPYKCQFCNKSYIAKNHLRIHMRVHTGERPFKCDVCSKSFGQQNILRDHRASHLGVRPYQCKLCPKRFVRISHLARHTNVVHKEGRTWKRELKKRPRPHKCEYCGICFTRKDHLIRHTSCHNGDRPFKCTLCDKTFVRKWDVKRHMVVHKDGNVTVIVPPIVAEAAMQQIDAS